MESSPHSRDPLSGFKGAASWQREESKRQGRRRRGAEREGKLQMMTTDHMFTHGSLRFTFITIHNIIWNLLKTQDQLDTQKAKKKYDTVELFLPMSRTRALKNVRETVSPRTDNSRVFNCFVKYFICTQHCLSTHRSDHTSSSLFMQATHSQETGTKTFTKNFSFLHQKQLSGQSRCTILVACQTVSVLE